MLELWLYSFTKNLVGTRLLHTESRTSLEWTFITKMFLILIRSQNPIDFYITVTIAEKNCIKTVWNKRADRRKKNIFTKTGASSRVQNMSHLFGETPARQTLKPICWCQMCQRFSLCMCYLKSTKRYTEGRVCHRNWLQNHLFHSVQQTCHPLPTAMIQLQSVSFPAAALSTSGALLCRQTSDFQTVQSFLPHWPLL